jgi:alpha-tubulin suppressor-like RCC1 family protein
MAWGENGLGELGTPTPEQNSDVPVAVSGLSEVTAIAAGGNHNLALLRNGTVMAWGYNAFGQLGDGTTTGPERSCSSSLPCSRTPVPVIGLSEVTAIAAGYNDSFALLRNGTVMSWGFSQFGALGNGRTDTATPSPVEGLSEVTAIAAGLADVSTALLKNGTVMDWGYGRQGELGNGTTESSDLPVAVTGLSGVAALPSGGHSMALLRNGTVVDWGLNGALGVGSEPGPELCEGIPCSRIPVTVGGLSRVTAIAGGLEHRLALLSDGTVMAWGNGSSGQLGNGAFTGSAVPVPVRNLSGVTSIGAGQYFSLAATLPPLPTVTRVEPDTGPPGRRTSVTITGTNFTGTTVVKFGSTDARSFTVTSAMSITAISPKGKGTVDVTVTTPSGTSPTCAADLFRYKGGNGEA